MTGEKKLAVHPAGEGSCSMRDGRTGEEKKSS